MAENKKSEEEVIDPVKAVAFVKEYIEWQNKVEEIKAADAGGETPPPPRWP